MAHMSSVMEKTLSSIPGLFASAVKSKSQENTQAELRKFIKSVDNVQSKQEEERVVYSRIATLKEQLAKPQTTDVQKRQSLTELLFCHLLGYEVSFSYIYAVKLAQQGNLVDKRTGYLLCSLFMHETHELAMLLINTIQKDLKSSNILVICTALSAACQLVSSEMIPAILPLVEEKLSHSRMTVLDTILFRYFSAAVRKKAVVCIHQFYLKAAELLHESEALFMKCLCDKDPSVMWAALHLYLHLIKTHGPAPYRKLVSVFSEILMQVVCRKLPSEYDHRSVPAPWLTICLLRVLAHLGHQCETTSMQIYPVLREVSQRTEPTHTIGLAVISECVETICTIHPDSDLLQFASKVVAKFLSAKNINIRYIGLCALSQLVSVDLKYTVDHQKAVIEFLDHEDLTIQRQTFHLLFRMANPKNIQVITKKLLDGLKQSSDNYLQNDIVTKLLSLTQRYGNDEAYTDCTDWYLHTINQLLSMDLPDLPDNLVSSVMDVLDQKPKETLRGALSVYWLVLQKQHLPQPLLQLACWVVSSHFSLSAADLSSVQVSSCLLSWMPRSQSSDSQRAVLVGLSRLLPRLPQQQIPPFVESIEASLKHRGRETNQMVKELKVLAKQPDILVAVTNAKTEEKMDFSLSFLDEYVCECLENGDSPYKPPAYRAHNHLLIPDQGLGKSSLRLSAYESPGLDSSRSVSSSAHSLPLLTSSTARSSDSTDSTTFTTDLQLKGVKKVWGKEGFKNTKAQVLNESESHMTDQSHPPATEKTEEEVKREEFTSALFSGIDTGEKHNTDSVPQVPVQTNARNHLNNSNVTDSQSQLYTQLHDPSSSEVVHDFDHHQPQGQRHTTTPLPQVNSQQEDGLKLSPQKTNISPSVLRQNSATMTYSHVIRDVAFDTDSLDGSLDLDAPPMLFHSEHEDLPAQSTQDDANKNTELYTQITSNS